MLYRIEKEGFEIRGVKLGQKCIYDGVETIVIGLDIELAGDFIAIRDFSNDKYPLSTTTFDCVILYKHDNFSYNWVSKDDIILLPFTPSDSDENLPPQISPTHALEIMEDEVNRLTHKYGLGEELRVVKECISVLKS
jgi:hypothetical protein